MRYLIAGGTGFVGEHLRRHLLAEYAEVVVLTTDANKKDGKHYFYWNPKLGICELEDNSYYDTLINLSGANIAEKYWTKKRKKTIVDSRTITTSFLASLIESGKIKTNYVVQASAIGFYGDQGDQWTQENSPLGSGFLAEVCEKWEDAAEKYSCPKSILRIGIVFHPNEGAFPKMIMGLKWRICNMLGNGKNYISWIDIDDLCQMILFLSKNKHAGTFNAVSPEPIRTLKLLQKLIEKTNRLSLTITIPGALIRFLLGDFSELFLSSQKVSSSKIENLGFKFSVGTYDQFLKKYKKYWDKF